MTPLIAINIRKTLKGSCIAEQVGVSLIRAREQLYSELTLNKSPQQSTIWPLGSTVRSNDRLMRDMGMETESNRRTPLLRLGISYHSLLIGVLSFIGGAAALLLVTNAVGATQVTFSVTGIISFIFGVALSSASIVLAVAAISLGRASERTVVERSDESIRLQNEVFVKTTDALGRIESSTGVTEKRIEDIISGRAGAIADRLVEHRQMGLQSREEIEKEIRESLFAELSLSPTVRREPRSKEEQAKREEIIRNYRKFTEKVLFHITDQSHTKTKKIGRGYIRGSGDDFADGIFKVPAGRIAVCTVSTEPLITDMFGSEQVKMQFINTILKELASETFQKVLLVFDAKLDADSIFRKSIEAHRDIAKEELLSKIVIIDGELDEVLNTTTKELAAPHEINGVVLD